MEITFQVTQDGQTVGEADFTLGALSSAASGSATGDRVEVPILFTPTPTVISDIEVTLILPSQVNPSGNPNQFLDMNVDFYSTSLSLYCIPIPTYENNQPYGNSNPL